MEPERAWQIVHDNIPKPHRETLGKALAALKPSGANAPTASGDDAPEVTKATFRGAGVEAVDLYTHLRDATPAEPGWPASWDDLVPLAREHGVRPEDVTG